MIQVVKLSLIIPENRVSRWINARVRRIGDRIVSKESNVGGIVKEAGVFVSVLLLSVSRWIIEATRV